MSLGGGREPPSPRPAPGAGLLALPFGISSTARPAPRLRFQLPPAPAGTGCPGLGGWWWCVGGGTVPAAGASAGPVPKRAWEHRRCDGRRVFLARCSVPHGQRKRLILTLGRRGLGWCQRRPAPKAVTACLGGRWRGAAPEPAARRRRPAPSPWPTAPRGVPSPSLGGSERWGALFIAPPPRARGLAPCETLTRAPVRGTRRRRQGGAGARSAVRAGPSSISGSAAAAARLPGPARPAPRRAGEQQEPLGCSVRPAGEARRALASGGFVCELLLKLLGAGRGSVQEQPLLKQNNLQKYRYSLCPRPDVAKEEQGSCPGQGLARPRGALGPRTWLFGPGLLQAPSFALALLRASACSQGKRFPYRQLPQSRPGPGHAVERRLSPAKGLRGTLRGRHVCVCAAAAATPAAAGQLGGVLKVGAAEPSRAWGRPWDPPVPPARGAHCSCVPQEM